ncbi:MAG: hypothetical protein NC311_10875 [Muribaculaceae bacterium]|nr:hypothetical protein [Muribaculaceae bacterium]
MNDLLARLLVLSMAALGQLTYIARTTLYEYQNDRRTSNVIGYKYMAVIPTLGYAQISVKILGEAQLDAPKEPYNVTFSNLRAIPYVNSRTNRVDVAFRADGIRAVK